MQFCTLIGHIGFAYRPASAEWSTVFDDGQRCLVNMQFVHM